MGEQRTVYNIGASNGTIMGIYLVIMFFAQSYGLRWFPSLLFGDLMMLGIPVLAYKLMSRDYVRYTHLRYFSAVWLNGIVMFICGSLIMALGVYVFLRFLEPGFLVEQIHTVAKAYRDLGTETSEQLANAFERIIETRQVPSPIAVAFSMVWLCSFLGSMLSMLLSLLIKYVTRRKLPA